MTVYGASNTKRTRATRAEMEERRDALYRIVEEDHPTSVRHAYYRAVVAGIVPKTEAGYAKVQRELVAMRRAGVMPYGWISDATRWCRRPDTYSSLEAALAETAHFYRRSLWDDAPYLIEVWAESDSIAGVVNEVTYKWDVALYPTKGFSSVTFAYNAAAAWNADGRPRTVLYVGDHDGAGLSIEQNVRKELAEHAEVEFSFERIGVTWDQVIEYDLPGTEPKKKANGRTRYEYDFPIAVEAEALPAPLLRQMLAERIEVAVDPDRLSVLQVAEESERDILYRIAGGVA